MNITINTEKSCDKMHHLFMVKTLRNTGTDESFLNLLEHLQKPMIALH